MLRPTKFAARRLRARQPLPERRAASAQRFYDPPGRVARISDMRGEVSYSPAGDGEWYAAHRNRPLVRGDALWSDRGARAELAGRQHLAAHGRRDQRRVPRAQRPHAAGAGERRQRQPAHPPPLPGQRVEIDTPNLALVLDRRGSYRIDVDREGDHTAIEARNGSGMVYGNGGRFRCATATWSCSTAKTSATTRPMASRRRTVSTATCACATSASIIRLRCATSATT
jgi:hypothetical protein